MWKYIGVVLFLSLFRGGTGRLTLNGVKCGYIYCEKNEYCSDFNKKCQPCQEICNPKDSNFEAPKCENDCQYYIHDQRYYNTTQNGNFSSLKKLQDEIVYLRGMMSITLALTCVSLVCLAMFFLFHLLRWKRKNHLTLTSLRSKFAQKKNEKHVPSVGVAVTNASGKPDVRLDIQNRAPSTPSTASTNVSSRRPTEDSTLDYAYDNPAMVTTPSTNNKIAKPYESSL